MTKEEINIVCDLYDKKAEIMKYMYTAESLLEIYKHDNDNEAAKYQCGKKYAYMDAMTIISEVINKIKNGGYNGTTDEKTKNSPM